MKATVRAKFKVINIQDAGEKDGKPLKTIFLNPVISGSQENEQFYAYTPGGSISLGTVNPEASAQFEIDKEYYVDFIPAE